MRNDITGGIPGYDLGQASKVGIGIRGQARTPKRWQKRDTLPEFQIYSDSGCDVSASCFDCPLVMCRYDAPGGLRGIRNLERDAKVHELRNALQMPVDDLAAEFNLSRRSVFRILRERGSAEEAA